MFGSGRCELGSYPGAQGVGWYVYLGGAIGELSNCSLVRVVLYYIVVSC